MTKKKKAGGKGKGEARAARPGKATPEERAAAREARRKANRLSLDQIAAQFREAQKAQIAAREPLSEENIDWDLRPKGYTPDLGARFLGRLASSSKSIHLLCREEGMPSLTTFWEWMEQVEGFAANYARARDMQSDHLAEECLDIANTQVLAEKVTISAKDGLKVQREDALGHRQLQIETRQWLISKLRPKKYGTHNLKIEGDPENPLLIGDPDSLSDEALAKIAATRAAKAAAGGKIE